LEDFVGLRGHHYYHPYHSHDEFEQHRFFEVSGNHFSNPGKVIENFQNIVVWHCFHPIKKNGCWLNCKVLIFEFDKENYYKFL